MFPLIPVNVLHDLAHEHLRPDTRRPIPPNRLDVQRHHLEHKTMYHLNTMVVEDLFSRRDTDLMARQQLAIATEGHVSTVARIRFTIGTKIVALGERIRPEAPVGDPRFNA